LIEGLCSSIPFGFEFSVFRSHICCSLSEEKICFQKKAVSLRSHLQRFTTHIKIRKLYSIKIRELYRIVQSIWIHLDGPCGSSGPPSVSSGPLRLSSHPSTWRAVCVCARVYIQMHSCTLPPPSKKPRKYRPNLYLSSSPKEHPGHASKDCPA